MSYPIEEQFAHAEAIHLSEPTRTTAKHDTMLTASQIKRVMREAQERAARGPVTKSNGYSFDQWCDELTPHLGGMMGKHKLAEIYEQDDEPWIADDRVRDYVS